MILRKIYEVLLECRDLLKLIQGDANAEMLTIDLISRNPKLQPLVATHNAPTEGAPTKRAKRQERNAVPLCSLQQKFGIDCKELKKILNAHGIRYSTAIFRAAGYKGHGQTAIKKEKLQRVEELLNDYGYTKK